MPDPSTLDPSDIDQKEDIDAGISHMLQGATENGLPDENKDKLRQLVQNNVDVFKTLFSAGPPAKIDPLHIELTSDAKPSRVRLRNYSQEQRQFLSRFVETLESAGMAYFNTSAA